jgi:hypothetical protein
MLNNNMKDLVHLSTNHVPTRPPTLVVRPGLGTKGVLQLPLLMERPDDSQCSPEARSSEAVWH